MPLYPKTNRALAIAGALFALAGLGALPPAAPSFAADLGTAPRLTWPVDCNLGQDCYIEDYVDADPAAGAQSDYACGIKSRDTHKGTDIALLSFETTEVAVRAAADGRVLRTRDSMADDRTMAGVTDGNACGNAVLLDHGGGWQSLYCHMRLGSLAVQPGQQVRAGDTLGHIGLSGQTTHPHLHLTIYRDGVVVDPFRPDPAAACGAAQQGSLWIDPPIYDRTSMITAAFSDGVPSHAAIADGAARRDQIAGNQPLVVYSYIGYAEDGDLLRLSARGPDGAQIFSRDIRLEQPQKARSQSFGRKAPTGGWPAGDYLGSALLLRDGRVVAHRFAHVTVP